ncbi:MAG: tetratricopeptide repeat protein [bacterium]|nr:tetratricopeptide repeat protein [bacterium]
MREKIILCLKILIILSIIALTALVYFQQGDFTSIDLGRHLEYGKLAFSQPEVLSKNVFSFTEPDFPNINHHWLSGVVFWYLYLIGGFKILSLLNILLGAAAMLLAFKLAVKKSNFVLASLLALPVILILSERVDIRPEMYSNLLIVLVFYLLDDFRSTKSAKNLVWLIPIFFLWVNLHIYFFIGLFMVGLAMLEQAILFFAKRSERNEAVGALKKLFYYGLGSATVCLVNPRFIKGFLFPFAVMGMYNKYADNYEIVENKSPFYLQNLMIDYNILIFKFLLLLLAASLIIYSIKKFKNNRGLTFGERLAKLDYFYIFSALFFSFFAVKYIRNLPIFALIALPIMAGNFYYAGGWLKEKTKKYGTLALFAVFFTSAAVFSWLIYDNLSAGKFLNKNLGLGVSENSLASIKFFKDNNLKGPIFNNFDIGSALDFWLYPGERVFVDNRPDTFSRDFFKEIYIPMQSDPAKWQEYREKYKINLIYFTHTDGTPWGRQFLANRLKDEKWPLIYFDDYTVIMVKDDENNKALVEKYKIDNGIFSSRLNNLLASSRDNEKMQLADFAAAYGRADLAENIYLDLLARRPADGRISAALGYLSAGQPDSKNTLKSIEYLEKAVRQGYALPGIYNQLGLDYWNLADYAEAEKMWRQALKIDKNNEHAKYYLKQANALVK